MNELQTLSKTVRPLPLDAEEFQVDNDVVIEKLDIGGQQMAINVAAREYYGLQPLEDRLRHDGARRVQRDGPAEVDDDGKEPIPNYPWHIRSTIDVAEDETTKEGKKT